jgi:hypothetical protein
MAKPKKQGQKASKKRGLPKNTAEWEALPDAEVMEHIFGKRGVKALKREALANEREPTNDYRLT